MVEKKYEEVTLPAETKAAGKKASAKKENAEQDVQTRKVAKEIGLHELIPVRNVTANGLNYVSSKTAMLTHWGAYGDIEYMEFGELMTMKSSQPRFLNEPFIIIDDEDVVEKLGLTRLYERLEEVADIDGFFGRYLEEMREAIQKLPNGSKKLLQDKAKQKVSDGTLYDIRKIKMLEQELSIDLQILID